MTTPSGGGRPVVVGVESHAHHRLPLVVVHARGMLTPTGAEGHLLSWQEWRRAGHMTAGHPDVDLHHEVMTGHPVEVLVRESRHALALVTGTRGLGGLPGMLLGSMSQGVLHHAHCPNVTVPQPDGS